MKIVNFYRKPISMFVMVAFTILLCFWANQSPAAPATAAAEKNSTASMEKGSSDGTGFIETEESEPVAKKGKKFPWLVVGAVVVIGAAAVYFLVLNKKYALTVNLGEGCTGTPAATAKYKKNKAVAYNFSTQSGYGNLQVKLDGATVPASGTVTMDKDHTLDVTATHGAAVNISSTPPGAKIFDNGADTGSVTPASFTYPAAGSHTYLLRQCGYQDFSQTQAVVVGQTYNINAALLPGILDNFLAPSPCWAPYTASDWSVVGGEYKSATKVKNWQYSFYNTVFSSSAYTVEVKMKRVKGSELASNSIVLSSGTSMSAVNGYLFNYSVSGSYSIWRENNLNLTTGTTTETAIKPWTNSPRINTHLGDWNTMKIVRSGSNYSFYLNGFLIFSFSEPTFDPRVVILAFYCNDVQTEMRYDYVKLAIGATAGLMPGEMTTAAPSAGQKGSEHQ